MSVFRRPEGCGAPAGVLVAIGLVCLVAVLLMFGCGTSPAPAATDTPTTVTVHVPFPVTLELDAPAEVTAVAETVTPRTTVLPDYDALADAEYADYECAQWAGEAIDAGWPHELVPKVLRTMFRESRCDPTVRSTTDDSSLMQINDIVLRDWRFQRDFPNFDWATIFDPHVNLTVALWLWNIDGWTPWRGGA